MTTIRKLERELNVTSVSLYAILRKSPYAEHVSRGKRNEILVDEVGANMLRDYYFNKVRGGIPRENDEGHFGVVSLLQEQLIKKDEQIKSLLEIISNQQLERAQ